MRKTLNRYGMKQNIEVNYEKVKREKYNRIYQLALVKKNEVIQVCNKEDQGCVERNYLKMAKLFASFYAEDENIS